MQVYTERRNFMKLDSIFQVSMILQKNVMPHPLFYQNSTRSFIRALKLEVCDFKDRPHMKLHFWSHF